MDTLMTVGFCLIAPGVMILTFYFIALIVEFIKTVAECIKNMHLSFAIKMLIILIMYVVGMILICISYYS